MNIVREEYTDFYKAVCVWNHKKNFTTFKRLFAVCGQPWAHSWQKLWFVVKNTANGRYKEIEKNFKLPNDKAKEILIYFSYDKERK